MYSSFGLYWKGNWQTASEKSIPVIQSCNRKALLTLGSNYHIKKFDEVIERSNSIEYGLISYIFTRLQGLAHKTEDDL